MDPRLLAILACPRCKAGLRLENPALLRCEQCSATYPVDDGIPILLHEDSGSRAQLDYQREFFNAEFAGFAEYKLENWRQSYIARIFPALGVGQKAASTYLDIGVGGSGYTVIEAARRGWTAVGCDLSINGIRKARSFAESQGVADRAFFVVCSAEALPFRDGAFDAISCIAVLEHLVRDDVTAKEMARTCRSGGRFFVTVPNTFFRTNLIFWIPSWLNDRRHGHLRHYTARSLSKLFVADFDHLEPRYSARTTKGAQLLLPKLNLASDDLWWKLERLDLKNPQSPWGAQLHMTGTKK